MRYAPSQQELNDIGTMAAPQRVQYFLTRVIEAEEIWSLADRDGWVMQEVNDRYVLPLWPYRQCADDCVQESDLQPAATSLDHFVERVLQILVAEGVQLELLPTRGSAGALLSAAELQSMFTSLMETGEYFLEG